MCEHHALTIIVMIITMIDPLEMQGWAPAPDWPAADLEGGTQRELSSPTHSSVPAERRNESILGLVTQFPTLLCCRSF